MIDNKQDQIKKLMHLGITKIDNFNCLNKDLIFKIASFEKGVELGSSNYKENTNNNVPYLRVGDLLDRSNCVYVDSSIHEINTQEEDIIIAFDGAPGRNAVCLYGIRSSGLYKLICRDEDKGLLFFELNSKLNQSIIKNHSQGTTILHASKAIPYLEYALIESDKKEEFNSILNQIIKVKKQIKYLEINKQLLLNKYFTNQ